jgi:hypothetical protein
MKIIHDPLPYSEGGFKIGAEFTNTNLREMLIARSFTINTIIELDEPFVYTENNENHNIGKYKVKEKFYYKVRRQYLVKDEE